MDLQAALLTIYESDDPATALYRLATALVTPLPLHAALRVRHTDLGIEAVWPAGTDVTRDLLDTAAHVLRTEVFPLASDLPFDAVRYPDSEMLLLPLRHSAGDGATLILIAPCGAFGEELQPWERVRQAMEQLDERHRRVAQAEHECERLRQRVEESEALHTLGLAANRTLNPEEVLNLVARFTRTLLGAHYVTVNTGENGRIHTVASVGLRAQDAAREDYLLARRVVEAEKPLAIGGAGAHYAVEEFPFHAAEGMRVGLGIPLSLFGESFGALIVGYRREYALTPRDTRLALTLAGHAAVAISNARLHQKVEQRSHELEAAYEQLRQLTAAKERFFNSISHDLRTPIGAVKGYAELLLEGVAGELPPQARSWVESTHRAAESLLALVSDLLDFARIEAGKMEMDPRPTTLAEIVEDALAAVRPQAEAKGLRLRTPELAALPPLVTDAKRVRQVLVNLLANAVKFTPAGEVTLEVDAPAAEGDAHYELRVRDTGPGIAPEDIGRIFEEFEQVRGSEGTGLGLPISRRLARLLGGELSAESEPGAGSTFVLRLPAVAERRNSDAVLAVS